MNQQSYHLHAPAAYPKKIPTRTTPATSFTPIIPMMTAPQTSEAEVMVTGTPIEWAMNPEESRPTSEEKFRMTSWRGELTSKEDGDD